MKDVAHQRGACFVSDAYLRYWLVCFGGLDFERVVLQQQQRRAITLSIAPIRPAALAPTLNIYYIRTFFHLAYFLPLIHARDAASLFGPSHIAIASACCFIFAISTIPLPFVLRVPRDAARGISFARAASDRARRATREQCWAQSAAGRHQKTLRTLCLSAHAFHLCLFA